MSLFSLIFAATIVTNVVEADTMPMSGDLIAIGDNKFVILSQNEYEKMNATMNLIRQRLDAANSNEQGRACFHGRAKRREIDEARGLRVTKYEDGYEHIETIFTAPTPKRHDSLIPRKSKPEGLEKVIKKRNEAKATTNEITVIVGGAR